MSREIGTFLDGKIASGALAGAAMMAIDRNGKTIHAYASGKTDVGGKDEVNLDTVFWIASCTKAITATACMQLVEQGKITLDEPADKYIPELTSNLQILDGYDGQGQPKMRPAKNKITLRHLLTHTSGLGYTFYNENLRTYAEQRGDHLEWRFKKKDFFLPLSFEPGTGYQYGLGLDWAGQIVESISGLSLEDYFQKHIFAPCGMKDTTFDISDRKDMLARLSKPLERAADGKLQSRAQPPYSTEKPEACHGGAGLFSTVPDYCKFLSTLVNDGICGTTGNRILKKETVELMSQDGIQEKLTETTLESPIPSANLALSNPLPNLQPDTRKGWGLSFLLNPDAVGSRGPSSFWWAGIANCFWWVDRANGVAGATFNQILPFGDIEVAVTWATWEKAVYELHEHKN